MLNPRLRPKFDSVDFVQLAWQSFFRMRDDLDRFQTPQHFVTYLTGLACNKVRMEVRERTTHKHDLQREIPLNPSFGGMRDKIGPEPEPVELAIARERWDHLVKDQPAHYRRIIKLKLQGHSCADVGRIVGLDAQTVRRFLQRLFEAVAVT